MVYTGYNWLKPQPPVGSPNHDGEAAPCKSYEELQDDYYLYAEEYEEQRNEKECN